MACLYDDSSISIVGSCKITEGKIKGIDIESYSIKIHTKKNKKPCLRELLDIMYVTLVHHDGSRQMLKVQIDTDEKLHSHSSKGRQCTSTCLMTTMPSNDSDDDKKLRDCESSIERECRAVGHMTLKPTDGSGSDVVLPIEAKFYVKYPNSLQQRPSRFKRAFACFFFSSN